MAIKIDLGEVALAMESPYDSGAALLDLKTGEVIYLAEEFLSEVDPDSLGMTRKELDALPRLVDQDKCPDRFLEIPWRSSHDGFEVMEEFVGQQTGDAQRILSAALEGPKPFRRFKDALGSLPNEVLKAWYAHKNAAEEAAIVAWLEEEEIEFERA